MVLRVLIRMVWWTVTRGLIQKTAGKQLEAIRQRLVKEGFCNGKTVKKMFRPLVDQLLITHQQFAEIDLQSIVYLLQTVLRTTTWLEHTGGTSFRLISIPSLPPQKK